MAQGGRRQLAFNTSWNLLDLVIGVAAGAIASILVARALGPDVLGRYQFLLWIGAIVSGLSSFGVPSALNRFLGKALAERDLPTMGMVLRLGWRMQGLMVLAVIAVLTALMFLLPASSDRLTAIVAWTAVPVGLMMALPTGLNGIEERFDRNVLSSLVATLLELALVLVTLQQGWGMLGLASARTIGRAVDCGVRYLFAWRSMQRYLGAAVGMSPPALLAADFRRMAMEGITMQSLNVIVLNRSEVFFLNRMHSPAQIAFFSLALGLSSYLSAGPTAFLKALSPRLYKSYARSPLEGVTLATRSIRLQGLLGAPLFSLAGIHATWLLPFIYGGEYGPAAMPAMVIALSMLPTLGTGQMTALIRAADAQRPLIRWTGVMVVITLALDTVLIYRGAALGAAIAFASARFLNLLALERLVAKATGHQVIVPRWRFLMIATLAGLIGLPLTAILPGVLGRCAAAAAGLLLYGIMINRWGDLRSDERNLVAELVRRMRDPFLRKWRA